MGGRVGHRFPWSRIERSDKENDNNLCMYASIHMLMHIVLFKANYRSKSNYINRYDAARKHILNKVQFRYICIEALRISVSIFVMEFSDLQWTVSRLHPARTRTAKYTKRTSKLRNHNPLFRQTPSNSWALPSRAYTQIRGLHCSRVFRFPI